MRFIRLIGFILSIFATIYAAHAQGYVFTAADSLMGSNTPERSCYDVLHYHLNMRFLIPTQSVEAYNDIRFKVLTPTQQIQLELMPNMKIDSVFLLGTEAKQKRKVPISRLGRSFYVLFPESLSQGSQQTVRVHYSGSPQIAKNPPWDGGFTWKKDKGGKTWLSVSCQGLGASVWLPCKDYLADEPDSVLMAFEAPDGLFVAANGNLLSEETLTNKTKRYTWGVSYNINPYCINFVLGNLIHIADSLVLANEEILPLDYYVLAQNKSKAIKHFQQTKEILLIFEELYGAYPFMRDGFALLETPFWGMEHQSGIAYGNDYQNNPYGFDFIILHEGGHEYFGNSLSIRDNAELWIHESFTTYTETLFLEKWRSPKEALAYLNGQRSLIANKQPPLSAYWGVNFNSHDNDIYYKGAWMLHTIRQSLQDDALWFAILKEFAQKYAYQHLNTEDVIRFFSAKSGRNLRPIFEQYLKHTEIPELVVKINTKGKQATLEYYWKTQVENFEMPIRVFMGIPEKEVWLKATNQAQTMQLSSLEAKHFRHDLQNFLVKISMKK